MRGGQRSGHRLVRLRFNAWRSRRCALASHDRRTGKTSANSSRGSLCPLSAAHHPGLDAWVRQSKMRLRPLRSAPSAIHAPSAAAVQMFSSVSPIPCAGLCSIKFQHTLPNAVPGQISCFCPAITPPLAMRLPVSIAGQADRAAADFIGPSI